jgi:hypothetical protein
MELKLDTKDRKRRDDICQKLRSSEDEALEEYAASIKAARKRLEERVAVCDKYRNALRKLALEVAAKARLHMLNKSDDWAASDQGRRAENWRRLWEELADLLEPIELQLEDSPEPSFGLREWEQVSLIPESSDEI